MIQRSFHISDFSDGSFENAINELRNLDAYNTSKRILVIIFDQNWDREESFRKRAYINTILPKAEVIGLTHFDWDFIDNMGATTPIDSLPNHSVISTLFFDSSDFSVYGYDISKHDEAQIGSMINEDMRKHDDVKGVMMLVSNTDKNIGTILKYAEEGYLDVPFFGSSAGSDFRVPPPINSKMLFYEDLFVSDYIFTIVFYGKDLHIDAHHNFGWTPIGKSMEVTKTSDQLTVETIDNEPAADIYTKYLGLSRPNISLFNICEFPVIVESGDSTLTRFPMSSTDNGGIAFGCTVNEGDRIQFTYGSLWRILNEVEEDSISFQDFTPEAMFLVVCINRKLFLKSDEDREVSCYRKVAPNLAHMHGNSEIFRLGGKGGEFNSALIAIGFREGDVNPAFVKEEIPKSIMGIYDAFEPIPLAHRMTSFLNAITTDLEEALHDAEMANQAKSMFLSSMSHEIRTPINAILGMNEMILRETNEDATKEYALDIQSAGNTLHSLINDILDISKIESGKMDLVPEEYEVISMVRDMATMISTRAKEKKLKFITDIDENLPSKLYGDDIRIRQILTNILSNAVKYTHTGSITIKISAKINQDIASVHCEIIDTGIGIKKEDIPKLFTAFQRLDENKNRNIEGTGLGMNITIKLLNMMGSELKVESEYGKGSKFYFDLDQKIIDSTPIGDISVRIKRDPAEYKYTSTFVAPDAKLLVVDDNEMNLKVFAGLLKKTKINITTALSGFECLELIKKEKFDIIFLDHMMPDMDGIQTLHEIRKLGDSSMNADTPVYALTANNFAGAAAMYENEGFMGYVSKPIVPRKLEELIKTTLDA